MTRSMVLLLAAVLAVPVLTTAQSSSYTVFVNAVGADKTLVTDLKADEFVVKENNKIATIVSAGQATTPMHVAIIVDDNGTGIFRAGINGLIQKLQGKAEFAISVISGQTMKLVDYTTDFTALSAALGRLGVRAATNDGGQLIEGVYETARDLEKRESRRSAILALTVGGVEQSSRDGKQVLDQLQKAGSALYVVETAGASQRQQAASGTPAEMLDGNMSLGAVLGDGPKQSGGTRTLFVSAALGNTQGLSTIADLLARQYAITYTLAAGQKPSGKLNVTSTRKGVTLLAPTKIPQR
jgi:VWFA-related protein